MGIAVGARVELRVGHRLALIENGGIAGPLLRLGFDNIHDAAGGMGFDQPQQPQGARDAAEIDGFALDRSYKAQSMSPKRSLSRAPLLIKIKAWMRGWIFA